MAEYGMKPPRSAQIVAVEKLKEGVLIEFDDRQCAIYSASLLYANLPHATKVTNTEPVSPTPRDRAGLKFPD
jgi:hypothetical protein